MMDATRSASNVFKHYGARPAPYAGVTKPRTTNTLREYGREFRKWFDNILFEPESPNEKRLSVLPAVERRLLDNI